MVVVIAAPGPDTFVEVRDFAVPPAVVTFTEAHPNPTPFITPDQPACSGVTWVNARAIAIA